MQIEVRNHATDELIGSVPDATQADVEMAVAEARASFEKKSWHGMDPSHKESILWDLSALLLKHKDKRARLESMGNGKTLGVGHNDAAELSLALNGQLGFAPRFRDYGVTEDGCHQYNSTECTREDLLALCRATL